MYIGYWWETQKERDHQEDQDMWVNNIKTDFRERENGVVWAGLIWLMIRTSGGLL
jgi:hypothetical protein